MADDPLAPKNLGRLRDNLVDYMHSHVAKPKGKTIVGKQKAQPKFLCNICGSLWGELNVVGDTSLTSKTCDECQQELDKGQIALVCTDGRHAFVFSAHLVGLGQIIKVSKETMDAVEKKAKEADAGNLS